MQKGSSGPTPKRRLEFLEQKDEFRAHTKEKTLVFLRVEKKDERRDHVGRSNRCLYSVKSVQRPSWERNGALRLER